MKKLNKSKLQARSNIEFKKALKKEKNENNKSEENQIKQYGR